MPLATLDDQQAYLPQQFVTVDHAIDRSNWMLPKITPRARDDQARRAISAHAYTNDDRASVEAASPRQLILQYYYFYHFTSSVFL